MGDVLAFVRAVFASGFDSAGTAVPSGFGFEESWVSVAWASGFTDFDLERARGDLGEATLVLSSAAAGASFEVSGFPAAVASTVSVARPLFCVRPLASSKSARVTRSRK